MQSIFFLLVALGCINIVSTYQCYNCDSAEKGACGDPFNANGMGDRDKVEVGASGTCTKTTVKTTAGSQVTRTGTPSGFGCLGSLNSCQDQTVGPFTAIVCCCTSNLCNGVSTVRQQPFIVFITMTTLVMLTYRWF